MFIPTCLSLLNYVSKSPTSGSPPLFDISQFSDRRMTFSHWTIENSKSPSTFQHLTPRESDSERVQDSVVELTKVENCLFMRKIMHPSLKYPEKRRERGRRDAREWSEWEEMWDARDRMLREWMTVVRGDACDSETFTKVKEEHKEELERVERKEEEKDPHKAVSQRSRSRSWEKSRHSLRGDEYEDGRRENRFRKGRSRSRSRERNRSRNGYRR
jgi:hypothetical protein